MPAAEDIRRRASQIKFGRDVDCTSARVAREAHSDGAIAHKEARGHASRRRCPSNSGSPCFGSVPAIGAAGSSTAHKPRASRSRGDRFWPTDAACSNRKRSLNGPIHASVTSKGLGPRLRVRVNRAQTLDGVGRGYALLRQLKLPIDGRGCRRAANTAEWFGQIANDRAQAVTYLRRSQALGVSATNIRIVSMTPIDAGRIPTCN